MSYVLVTVLGAAGIAGTMSVARSSAAPHADAKPERAPDTAFARSQPAPEDDGDIPGAEGSSAAIEGRVLEVLQVPKYTYLRIATGGSEGTWTAVPSANVEVGATARVTQTTKMTGFSSAALKRSFPVVFFGTLDARPGQVPGDIPAAQAGTPHGPPGPLAVERVDRASGSNANTVAEIIAQRAQLVGKTVRLRARVVKATAGVLGRTYLHLRDGSGDHEAGTDDIAATTEATPAVGDTILIEAKVVVDRDIGAGYRFPTLLEDARILPAAP